LWVLRISILTLNFLSWGTEPKFCIFGRKFSDRLKFMGAIGLPLTMYDATVATMVATTVDGGFDL